MSRRVDLKGILANPTLRRRLMVQAIIATQAREGIVTTRAQAESAYDRAITRHEQRRRAQGTPRAN